MAMHKDTPRTQPPSQYQWTSAINEIHRSVQENCSAISALAQLALAAVHAPQEHHSQQALAHALRTIRDSADLLAGHVKVEARRVA
jgi:FtsZ-interacting cell division protein ZipA